MLTSVSYSFSYQVRLQTSYTAAAASAAQRQKKSVLGQLAAAAQQRGGVRLLFRGSSMLLLRNIPGNGVFFSAFEGVRGCVRMIVCTHIRVWSWMRVFIAHAFS